MENNTPQSKEHEDRSVQDAVRDVLALRSLAKTTNMRTTHSQTAILKKLTPTALARVAVIIEAFEKGSAQ